MIKANIGDNVAVLGLSDNNMLRLAQGKPIKFNMKELGFGDIEVIIFNGKDEDTMAKELTDMVGTPTEFKDKRPQKDHIDWNDN